MATTISVAEEANTSPAGANKACSDGGSQKDKHGDGERTGAGRTGAGSRGASPKRPLCHGSRLRKELLCLQRVRAHGPALQKQGEDGRRKEGGVRGKL